MAHFHNNALVGASGQGGYLINQSLRFNPTDSTYLNRTPASAGNQKTWTYSVWIKRSLLSSNIGIFMPVTGGDGFNECQMRFDSSDRLQVYDSGGAAGYLNVVTTRVFRDCSAWYHLVFVYDSTQATSSNRFKIYVNGTQETSFSTAQYPNQNNNSGWNGTSRHDIGRIAYASNQYFGGYLSESHMIDGTALTPSSFGETDTITGAWIPKKYSGSYGTNGFYLKFADNSGTTSTTLGKDSSGNGNNWTPNNFSVTAGAGNDSLTDTPTPYADGGNGRGNYCTWNPVEAGNGSITFANGNLQLTHANAVSQVARGTFAVSSGKWYWEVEATTAAGCGIGVIDQANAGNALATGVFLYGYASGNSYNNGSFTTYGATFTDGDIIGVALDKTANTLTFYKNGVSQGTFTSSLTTSAYQPAFSRTTGTPVCNANFGQRAFAYTPPTGFKALSTGNLPEPTIKKGGAHFNTVLYTGTAATQSITGVGFQPDLIWTKARNGAYSHNLTDAVRGITNGLASNSTSAEYTIGLTSFDADGFSMGAGNNQINGSTITYAAWNWKANGAGSSNTAGSITSTVSANATAGFSIVTWTGTGADGSYGHGLGVQPAMIIHKRRDSTSDWHVWHKGLPTKSPTNDVIYLNLTNAQNGGNNNLFRLDPTSTLIYTGSAGSHNVNGATYVDYVFSEVAGYSKFGSYTGNGSSDGPFVFCGFRPAFIMIKRTDTTGNWTIHDNRRLGYNGSSASKELYPNLSNSEGTDNMDQLSNGFKLRDTYSDVNASGGTYIFAAFSETAFKYANAR